MFQSTPPPKKNYVFVSPLPHICPMPSHHNLFDLINRKILCNCTDHEFPSSSSSSSPYICHAVRPPVDPFRSHVSRSLLNFLPRFLLPVGQQCFITLGNLFRGILFTRFIQLLLYSSNLSKNWCYF